MTQTPTETLTAAVPELQGYSAMDLDALWHLLSLLVIGDDRRRVLDDIRAHGLAEDDGSCVLLTERGEALLAALTRWYQDGIVADAAETQPLNLRLAEAALRMQAERFADHPFYACGLTHPESREERERRGCRECVSAGRPRERVVGCVMVGWYEEAAGRVHGGAEAESTTSELDPLEVAVLQRLDMQLDGRLSAGMWTVAERNTLAGLMLIDVPLADLDREGRVDIWLITPEGRAALEAQR